MAGKRTMTARHLNVNAISHLFARTDGKLFILVKQSGCAVLCLL